MYRHLTPHVYIADVQGCFVVLDTRHDRYIPLSARQSNALRRLLGGGEPAHTGMLHCHEQYAEFLIYPRATQCLVWAVTRILLAAREGKKLGGVGAWRGAAQDEGGD